MLKLGLVGEELPRDGRVAQVCRLSYVVIGATSKSAYRRSLPSWYCQYLRVFSRKFRMRASTATYADPFFTNIQSSTYLWCELALHCAARPAESAGPPRY